MAGVSQLKVEVRLFASYRERAGTARLDLDLPDGSTIADAAAKLLQAHPAITNDPTRLVVAVNQEYQEHDHPLQDGDEVALIPPVSGGSR